RRSSDLPVALVPWSDAVFGVASVIYVICPPTVAAIHRFSHLTRLLQREEMTNLPIQIVLNRFTSNRFGDISVAQFEKSIGRDVRHKIPNDYALISASQNQGKAALRPWNGERTRRTEETFLPGDRVLTMFQKVFGETTETDGAKKPTPASSELPMQSALRPEGMVARNSELKVFLHEKLLGMLNLGVLDKVTRDDLGRQLAPLIRDLLSSENIALNVSEYNQIVTEVLDEVLGLGPLEPFLKDPTVSDILVNTYRQVYVERAGRLEPTPAHFKDERHLMRIIQKIVGAVGRRVDESQPWVDARLADGSRVNVLVPPCAVDGPLLSIRKFSKTPLTVAKLVELGTIDRRIALVLEIIVRSRLNVLISAVPVPVR